MPAVATRRRHRGAVCAAALLLSTAVLSGSGAAQPSRGGSPVGDVSTVLRWKPCTGEAQRGFECATTTVPLDHTRPRWRTVDLAVIRHRATAPRGPARSLFFNPGGPGGAGTVGLPELYEKFPAPLRERFDIISWDPRGVGQSTPVRCFGTAEEATAWHSRVPAFPVGEEQRKAFTAAYADLGRRCERHDPELLRHISTADVARDLDRLRRAAGEEHLRYWGISYGTLLGATYANLFPSRVDRLVLDGNVDPRAWMNGGSAEEPELSTFLRLESDRGSAETLRQFLDLCGGAPAGRCAFSAGRPAATRAKFTELMRRLRARPVGSWTYAKAVSEVRGGLYTVHPGWTQTAEALQTLWEGRAPQEPPAPPGAPAYPGFEQSLGVLCAESPHPGDPGRYAVLDTLSTARSGDLGHWWAWANEPCAAWPATAAARHAGPWDRPTAHPVLVVNPTYDPATPYGGGRAMARELANTRLLTLKGYGHTALDNPSSCVSRHAVRYFLGGALPPVGATCEQDAPPFAPGPPADGPPRLSR
ncbi:alpha/beta hydrolase [Streptomyces sp. NBC_01233]|uniref:alpha/beta hydrolase n=1 Tax=Streptomyces sp. NBC_01233 TaxID=2903787 RepID=UPI002E12BEFE|nr:alpha/beta hydrolase [Streptomyces sp. NBC_01233]